MNDSDEKLKENIEILSVLEAKDFLNNLKPKKYNFILSDVSENLIYKSCCPKTNYGFIAQDVELFACDHVIHFKPPEDDKCDRPQGVDYTQIISPLVKVVQDLMIQIEKLQTRVSTLELLSKT